MTQETESYICPQCGYEQIMQHGALLHRCLGCGSQNWREPKDVPQPSQTGPLAQFDAALATINSRRGASYGHPSVNFARVVKLQQAVPAYEDPRLQHIVDMILVKLARLAGDPTHVDSLVDVAGYARTWAMILDAEQPSKAPSPHFGTKKPSKDKEQLCLIAFEAIPGNPISFMDCTLSAGHTGPHGRSYWGGKDD